MVGRKIIIISFILIFLSLFSNAFALDKVAADLLTYWNQGLINIAELEKTSLEKYASVIGENYTTDDDLYTVLKDQVIPVYDRFYAALREIRPEMSGFRPNTAAIWPQFP